MKKASLPVTGVAALAFSASAFAQAPAVVDDDVVAARVATYIDNCNGDNTRRGCIAAVADMSLSLAKTMTQYVDRTFGASRPSDAGIVRGELLASCAAPMNDLGDKLYEDMDDYLAATFNAVNACERSIRRAEQHIGIVYQPTARSIVKCRLGRLHGYSCDR